MEELTNEAVVQTKKTKRPLIVIGVLLAAVLLGYLALCVAAASTDKIYPNRTMRGIDVGGLTVEAAAEKIAREFPSQTFTIRPYTAAGEPELPPLSLPYEALGATLNSLTAAKIANRDFDSGNFFSNGWDYLLSLLGLSDRDTWCSLDLDEAAFQAGLSDLLDRLTAPPQDTSYELTDEGILVTVARDGLRLSGDLEAASFEEQLRQHLAVAESEDVPLEVLPARTLTARDIHDAVSGEVKNAGYDAATDAITPEQVGAEFDIAAAQSLLDAAAPGETVTVPAQVTFPKVTAEALKAVLFRDVLGECRTHVSGTAARITNVKLSAAAINGAVLNSGETFSYNETTGQRTAAKGYQAAPAYVKGETVDEIGGGVCQPSSTLYYACLRANLEITERYAHRYIPSYITPGMDATVSWGGPDYKFTNNTDYPIKVETSYAKGYLTMRLLGTKTDDITVKMTNEALSTTPFETVYEDDPTLAPGTETVKTTPYTGYKYKTYRNLYDGDGNLISSTYEATSDYKARNKVILRGPAPVTEPDAPAIGPAELPAETPEPLPETPPETPEVPAEPAISETELPVVLPEEPGIVGE